MLAISVDTAHIIETAGNAAPNREDPYWLIYIFVLGFIAFVFIGCVFGRHILKLVLDAFEKLSQKTAEVAQKFTDAMEVEREHRDRRDDKMTQMLERIADQYTHSLNLALKDSRAEIQAELQPLISKNIEVLTNVQQRLDQDA